MEDVSYNAVFCVQLENDLIVEIDKEMSRDLVLWWASIVVTPGAPFADMEWLWLQHG